MANTYVAIATVTVGSGGAANIEFTSIPATYTDLVLKISSRATVTTNGYYYDVTFNNSTTTGIYLRGTGSSTLSGSYNLWGTSSQSDFTASTFSNGELYIPNYASSNNKSMMLDSVNENNTTAADQVFSAGLWSNTAVITSIKLVQGAGNFAQYSTATLYGIKNS